MASTKKPADPPKDQPAHDHSKGDCTDACAPEATKAAGPELAKAKPPESAAAAATAIKPAAPLAPPPSPPAETVARYRVWAHGSLQRDGETHEPGAELTLPCVVGDAIECLSKV